MMNTHSIFYMNRHCMHQGGGGNYAQHPLYECILYAHVRSDAHQRMVRAAFFGPLVNHHLTAPAQDTLNDDRHPLYCQAW